MWQNIYLEVKTKHLSKKKKKLLHIGNFFDRLNYGIKVTTYYNTSLFLYFSHILGCICTLVMNMSMLGREEPRFKKCLENVLLFRNIFSMLAMNIL